MSKKEKRPKTAENVEEFAHDEHDAALVKADEASVKATPIPVKQWDDRGIQAIAGYSNGLAALAYDGSLWTYGADGHGLHSWERMPELPQDDSDSEPTPQEPLPANPTAADMVAAMDSQNAQQRANAESKRLLREWQGSQGKDDH